MENQKLNLRLDSCREVLQAINNMLHRLKCNQRMLQQMDQLEQLMMALDTNILTESDIIRIENSTNQLFDELTRLFTQPGVDKLHHHEVLH